MNAVEALDEMARIVTTTPRKRSPLEAPAGFTDAYIGLLLAYGYARLGLLDRAHQLAIACRTPLLDQLDEPVHGYLVSTFDARIDTAITCAPSPSTLKRLLTLARAARYKVDRLRDHVRILSPAGEPAAVQTWVTAETLVELNVIASDCTAACAIEILNTVATLPLERRVAVMRNLLCMLVDVDLSIDRTPLHRAIEIIAELPEAGRAYCYAQLLVVATRFEIALVPKIVDALLESLPWVTAEIGTRTEMITAILELLVPRVIQSGLESKMLELLAVAERMLERDSIAARIWISGGRVALGHADDVALFETTYAQRLTLILRLDIVRARTAALSYLASDEGLPQIVTLARQITMITDSYGTNSHACLSVMQFVESLVLGVVGTIAPVERGHDRRGDEYSARGG